MGAVTLCSWPLASLEPGVGLDASWQVALHMAAHDGLDAGRDVVFTYGPLGFLGKPLLAYPATTRLAFAAFAVTQVALAAVVVLGLQRMFGSLVAAAVAGVAVVALIREEPLAVIGFALAYTLLTETGGRERRGVALAGLLGAVAGYGLLLKLNTGVLLVALGVVAVMAGDGPRGRRGFVAVLGFAASFALGWAAAGQSAAAVPDYLVRSATVVAGYSQSMGAVSAGRAWQPVLAVTIAAIGALAIVLEAGSRGVVRSRRTVGLFLLWIGFAFALFKAGFVRQYPVHVQLAVASMLAAACLLPLRAIGTVAASLLLFTALVAAVTVDDRGVKAVTRPVAHVRSFASELALVASRDRLAGRIAAARTRVGAGYGIDAAALRAVGRHGVHLGPFFAAVAWADGLRWQPLPVFQDYVAYTPALDALNARTASGAAAPARIARHHVDDTIDGRNVAWESPAAMRAMLCHYRALSTSGVDAWQVLGRVANRCGPRRLLRVVDAARGAPIPIPAAGAGEYGWVAIRADTGGVGDALRSLVLRAPERRITLDGRRSYRVVPATLPDGLVLSVPSHADFPAPFRLDEHARTVTVRGGGSRVELRFYAAAIR